MLKFSEFTHQELTEAELKAEDYEASIVIGWYNVTKQPYTLEQAGVSEAQVEVLRKNPKVIIAGEKIAEYILKNSAAKKGDKAEVFGRVSNPVTSFWKQFEASNTTPKTDVKIGKLRFSVKIGLAQLMSGGRAESLATFNAALTEVKTLDKSPQVEKVRKIIDSFIERGLAPGQLRDIIKSGKNEVVNAGEAAHKDCMRELGTLFEQSREFKIAFAREAMSGFQKFGEKSASAAEFMLVSSHDGSSVQIHSVYDDAYCESIADKMRLQARFKTSSRKLQGQKTGEYNFWSVVSLIVDAMEKVKQEDYNPQDIKSLNEFFSLSKIATAVRSKIAGALSKVKSFFAGGIRKVMDFLGAEPEISVASKVDFSQ